MGHSGCNLTTVSLWCNQIKSWFDWIVIESPIFKPCDNFGHWSTWPMAWIQRSANKIHIWSPSCQGGKATFPLLCYKFITYWKTFCIDILSVSSFLVLFDLIWFGKVLIWFDLVIMVSKNFWFDLIWFGLNKMIWFDWITEKRRLVASLVWTRFCLSKTWFYSTSRSGDVLLFVTIRL